MLKINTIVKVEKKVTTGWISHEIGAIFDIRFKDVYGKEILFYGKPPYPSSDIKIKVTIEPYKKMKNQHIKEKKFIQSFLDNKCKNLQYNGQIFDIRLDELLKEFLDSWNNNPQRQ